MEAKVGQGDTPRVALLRAAADVLCRRNVWQAIVLLLPYVWVCCSVRLCVPSTRSNQRVRQSGWDLQALTARDGFEVPDQEPVKPVEPVELVVGTPGSTRGCSLPLLLRERTRREVVVFAWLGSIASTTIYVSNSMEVLRER